MGQKHIQLTQILFVFLDRNQKDGCVDYSSGFLFFLAFIHFSF